MTDPHDRIEGTLYEACQGALDRWLASNARYEQHLPPAMLSWLLLSILIMGFDRHAHSPIPFFIACAWTFAATVLTFFEKLRSLMLRKKWKRALALWSEAVRRNLPSRPAIPAGREHPHPPPEALQFEGPQTPSHSPRPRRP